MFDYQTAKQPLFDDACRKFANQQNLADVARAVNIRPQMLRNKLNPEQPHKLTCEELLAITDATEDATLLDGLLAQLKCMPAVPMNEANAERITTYVLQATAAMGAVAAESMSTERMSQSRRHAFISSINSGIKYLSLVGLSLQTRIQSNPALASTVDAISGIGASLNI
ncbi:phage regulatory CII family protein [Dickeya dadantii]|uniref:phage regulatory CII family protein n=1 Tax=Dickeya dadantii TaxID=204038 RepID=UPI001CC49006|nr:phage regulatory CII family protein [Dickeya dadantii]UAY94961.1 phage regulatory CII family protein [Dickeya dadantii]